MTFQYIQLKQGVSRPLTTHPVCTSRIRLEIQGSGLSSKSEKLVLYIGNGNMHSYDQKVVRVSWKLTSSHARNGGTSCVCINYPRPHLQVVRSRCDYGSWNALLVKPFSGALVCELGCLARSGRDCTTKLGGPSSQKWYLSRDHQTALSFPRVFL